MVSKIVLPTRRRDDMGYDYVDWPEGTFLPGDTAVILVPNDYGLRGVMLPHQNVPARALKMLPHSHFGEVRAYPINPNRWVTVAEYREKQ